MEELREKAINYAEENVINVLKEAFAKVYADGYRDGYKDCKKEIPVDLRLNQTEFVDLGLPSGTLWAVDYEKKEDQNLVYLTYEKACEFNIPSKEQWNELYDNCRTHSNHEGSHLLGVTFVGPNGNSLKFDVTGLINAGGHTDAFQVFFWLNDIIEGNEKKAVQLARYYHVVDRFSGYKLPIRLVRAK